MKHKGVLVDISEDIVPMMLIYYSDNEWCCRAPDEDSDELSSLRSHRCLENDSLELEIREYNEDEDRNFMGKNISLMPLRLLNGEVEDEV